MPLSRISASRDIQASLRQRVTIVTSPVKKTQRLSAIRSLILSLRTGPQARLPTNWALLSAATLRDLFTCSHSDLCGHIMCTQRSSCVVVHLCKLHICLQVGGICLISCQLGRHSKFFPNCILFFICAD